MKLKQKVPPCPVCGHEKPEMWWDTKVSCRNVSCYFWHGSDELSRWVPVEVWNRLSLAMQGAEAKFFLFQAIEQAYAKKSGPSKKDEQLIDLLDKRMGMADDEYAALRRRVKP